MTNSRIVAECWTCGHTASGRCTRFGYGRKCPKIEISNLNAIHPRPLQNSRDEGWHREAGHDVRPVRGKEDE